MQPTPQPLINACAPVPGAAAERVESHASYQPGDVIAEKYRLDLLLGEGGMGSVWQATNLQLECTVALKLIRAGLDREDLRLRLFLEARSAASLAHPGIVRVFDIGQSNSGDPFIVMELLAGKTLTQCSFDEPLGAVEAVQLLLPVVDALSAAHAHGIVHRDLKPDNIFIVDDSGNVTPKVLDFGVAKSSNFTTGLTLAGTLVGTPEYMAPEAARGETTLDARADIWSLCVVLYEQIAGGLPFDGHNLLAVLSSIVEQEPRPLPAHIPGGAELWQVLQRGLAKQPENRFQSMTELGRALATWLVSQGVYTDASRQSLKARWLPVEPTATTKPARSGARSRLHRVWLFAGAGLLLASFGAWGGMRAAPAPAATPVAAAKPAPTSAVPSKEVRAQDAEQVTPTAPSPQLDSKSESSAPVAVAATNPPRRVIEHSAASTVGVATRAAHSPTSDLIAPY